MQSPRWILVVWIMVSVSLIWAGEIAAAILNIALGVPFMLVYVL